MVGFDVHRDTIAACVSDEDLWRYFDAHEFSPLKPQSLSRLLKSTRSE